MGEDFGLRGGLTSYKSNTEGRIDHRAAPVGGRASAGNKMVTCKESQKKRECEEENNRSGEVL